MDAAAEKHNGHPSTFFDAKSLCRLSFPFQYVDIDLVYVEGDDGGEAATRDAASSQCQPPSFVDVSVAVVACLDGSVRVYQLPSTPPVANSEPVLVSAFRCMRGGEREAKRPERKEKKGVGGKEGVGGGKTKGLAWK
jgi:hypothetical protein